MRTNYEAYLTVALKALESAFDSTEEPDKAFCIYGTIKDVKRLLEEESNDNQNESN
jgi:hypothetical protein